MTSKGLLNTTMMLRPCAAILVLLLLAPPRRVLPAPIPRSTPMAASEIVSSLDEHTEMAAPDIVSSLDEHTEYVPASVAETMGLDGHFVEGDIRLKPGDHPFNLNQRSKRTTMLASTTDENQATNGTGNSSDTPLPPSTCFLDYKTWPNQIVYYKFAGHLPPELRSTFDRALDEWRQATCLTFVLAETQEDYLFFTDRAGCSSFVGMTGGKQEVSIDNTCSKKGHAMHEIGHALGLWHEHSRPDRDNYIKVNYANIRQESLHNNFKTLCDRAYEPIGRHNVKYDYESIMHYDKFAFSKHPGSSPTIELREDINFPACALVSDLIGQRSRLSWRDQLRMNKLYQCTAKIAALEASPPACDPLVPDSIPSTPAPSSASAQPSSTPTVTPSPTRTATPTPTPTPCGMDVRNEAVGSRVRKDSMVGLVLLDSVSDSKSTPSAMFCGSEGSCYAKTCNARLKCYNTEYKFEIEKPKNKKNRNIRVGDLVAFRSQYRRTKWLECNDGECTITDCLTNLAELFNTSEPSECSQHYFRVASTTKEEGTAIKFNEAIMIKHPHEDTYLNCAGRNCKMLPYGACPAESSGSGSDTGSASTPQWCCPQAFVVDMPVYL